MVEQAQYDIEIRESNRSQVRTEQAEEQSIDLGPVLRTLYRGRKTLIVVVAVTLVLALAAAYIIPPGYTSTASSVPPNASVGSSGAAALAGQLSQLSGLGTGILGGVKSTSDLY